MKKITETKEIITTLYQAVDDTIFDNANDCVEYEKTLAVVLLVRLAECKIAAFNGNQWFCENSEHDYMAVVPKTLYDIETLNQLYLLYEGKHKDSLLFNESDLNTVIFVVKRLDGNSIDWIWFWKFNELVKLSTDNKWKLIENC